MDTDAEFASDLDELYMMAETHLAALEYARGQDWSPLLAELNARGSVMS